jgi:hypothetical protein
MYGLPRATIRRWRNHIKTNSEWTPAETHWGEHRRIFDHAKKSALTMYMRFTFSRQHRSLTSEDFRVLALATYCEVDRGADDAPRFCCSPAFILGFMVRHHFSVRREHFQGRSSVSDDDTAIWIQRLRHLFATENYDLILNCDETAWRIYPSNILTSWNTVQTTCRSTLMEMKKV